MAEQSSSASTTASHERRTPEGGRELLLPSDGKTPERDRGTIFFVGTATVLLRYAGFTILTDPNFLHRGDHVHLGYGLSSKRQTNPAVEIEALPPLDLVVLSHLHGDHFDRIAEDKLDKSVPILTTKHAAAYLQDKGFRSPLALATWETFTVIKGEARLRITSMPGRHGPAIVSKLLPPVMGSMLEFQNEAQRTSFRLYISGDTLVYDDLREIPRRYPDIDLALLHLGGTRILGILVTMDAKQGVEAIRLIQPRKAIPIHYNDYTVFKSTLDDFKHAVIEAGLQERVHYLNHGDTYTFEVPASRWQA
jgi:L-ascorbate metabolism protein UlaG (beta-lactamase superfamily)